MNNQTAEEHQKLRNDVMNSLTQHHEIVRISSHQIYDKVNRRIVKVENMQKKQENQI